MQSPVAITRDDREVTEIDHTPRLRALAASTIMGFIDRKTPDETMDTKFTAAEMLQLPRPGAGVANPDGDYALVAVSQHSFDDDKYVMLLRNDAS